MPPHGLFILFIIPFSGRICKQILFVSKSIDTNISFVRRFCPTIFIWRIIKSDMSGRFSVYFGIIAKIRTSGSGKKHHITANFYIYMYNTSAFTGGLQFYDNRNVAFFLFRHILLFRIRQRRRVISSASFRRGRTRVYLRLQKRRHEGAGKAYQAQSAPCSSRG